MPFRRRFEFLHSAGNRIAVELLYPGVRCPRSGVIFGQGLRSYNRGFLSNMAMAFVRAGYLAVKFDFVGTGRSEGRFEEKLTSIMLKNLEDVMDRVAAEPGIKHLGLVLRSNAGGLFLIHGPDVRVRAVSFVATPIYYRKPFANFLQEGSIRRGFLYHPSFKRKHTKGPGRLPLRFFTQLTKYQPVILRNVSKIHNVIHFQSTTDEVLRNDGHFEYLAKHLPKPKRGVRVPNVTHSFLPGKQHIVIAETVRWFKKHLP